MAEPSGEGAIESTLPVAAGFQEVKAPVEVLKAARYPRYTPLTWVKLPPTYKVLPSGEAARAVTSPSSVGLNEVTRAPLLALNSAIYVRATSPVPEGAPGGRTEVNWPPTNTLPFAEASAQTVLLVCQEGATVPLTFWPGPLPDDSSRACTPDRALACMAGVLPDAELSVGMVVTVAAASASAVQPKRTLIFILAPRLPFLRGRHWPMACLRAGLY